jgi:hypothetical protein
MQYFLPVAGKYSIMRNRPSTAVRSDFQVTKLTDLAIRHLPTPERGQKTYFEGEGFGVRVSQGGTKTFVQMYGPERRLKSLGRYPVMSLRDARKAAKAVQVTPEVKRTTSDTKAAVRAFLAECDDRLRPATVYHYDLARVQRLPWPADYAAKLI